MDRKHAFERGMLQSYTRDEDSPEESDEGRQVEDNDSDSHSDPGVGGLYRLRMARFIERKIPSDTELGTC